MLVFETTGHFGLPRLFYIEFTEDTDQAPVTPDPNYSRHMIGFVQTENGEERGRVLHQFSETDDGFKCRLGLYWPDATDDRMVWGHCWHLAVEFVNWVEMYLSEEGAD
jgi:hypothetical protein